MSWTEDQDPFAEADTLTQDNTGTPLDAEQTFDTETIQRLESGERITLLRDDAPFAVVVPSHRYALLLRLENEYISAKAEEARARSAQPDTPWSDLRPQLLQHVR